MLTATRTTATCKECGHHVQVSDGKIAFHRAEGVDCPGIGSLAELDVDTITQDQAGLWHRVGAL